MAPIPSKWPGTCKVCGATHAVGTPVTRRDHGGWCSNPNCGGGEMPYNPQGAPAAAPPAPAPQPYQQPQAPPAQYTPQAPPPAQYPAQQAAAPPPPPAQYPPQQAPPPLAPPPQLPTELQSIVIGETQNIFAINCRVKSVLEQYLGVDRANPAMIGQITGLIYKSLCDDGYLGAAPTKQQPEAAAAQQAPPAPAPAAAKSSKKQEASP